MHDIDIMIIIQRLNTDYNLIKQASYISQRVIMNVMFHRFIVHSRKANAASARISNQA